MNAPALSVYSLFSQVGIAFSDRRKSSSADTIADLIFTKMNVECLDGELRKIENEFANSVRITGRK